MTITHTCAQLRQAWQYAMQLSSVQGEGKIGPPPFRGCGQKGIQTMTKSTETEWTHATSDSRIDCTSVGPGPDLIPDSPDRSLRVLPDLIPLNVALARVTSALFSPIIAKKRLCE